MVEPPRHHSGLLLACIISIILLFSVGLIQPEIISVKAQWTYPSGYDPHGGYVDRLTFIVYPGEDRGAVFLALQAGTVYSYDENLLLSQEVPELEADPAIEVSSELATWYRMFSCDCDMFPTNLTGYRRALTYALDKHAVVENARGGFAQVMDNPIPLAFNFWTYESQMPMHFYTEDIVSANATLDAAHIIDTPDSPHPGWRYYDADMSGTWTESLDKRGDFLAPDGLKTEIIVSQGYDPAIQASLVLVEAMEKCGLQGEVVEWDFNSLILVLPTPDWNLICFSLDIDTPGYPNFLFDWFHSEGYDNSFIFNFNNSEYDYNCSMFKNAATRLEARNWAWNCCQILIEEMPLVVCYNDEAIHAYRTDAWEGYIPQVGINRMGGNSFTYQQIRLKDTSGGPFGCIPTEYVTVLTNGLRSTNTLKSGSKYTQTIMELIYSSLLTIDPLDFDTNTAPDLAHTWWVNQTTASGDVQEGMKFTFILYDNITWHDGTPFTAEDVQYSLMNIHQWGPYTRDNVANIYRVDTPDEYTVEIYSNTSSYFTFTQLIDLQILPEHIWSPYESYNFSWTPETRNDFAGTGCYQWYTRVAGQYICLDRYAGWHFAVEHPPRPYCYVRWTPPWWLAFLIVLVVIESVILGILVYRRQQRLRSKTK